MVKLSEGTFALSDGTKLYEKIWEPDSTPTAHMIALHGFSDHVNAYYNLFPTLASEPYNVAVHGIDQRGWGRSVHKKSDRGLSGGSPQIMKDVAEYVRHVSKQIKSSSSSSSSSTSIPLFLFGHSMGGNEAVYYLLTTAANDNNSSPIAGLVLESPFIGFSAGAEPPAITVFAGKLAAKVLPSMQMKNALDASAMSHDPKVNEDWVNDELCHDTGTLAGIAALLQRADELEALAKTGKKVPGMRGDDAAASALSCPVFWAHGTGDKVCSFDASKALYERIGRDVAGSECKWYEDAYHKIHAEPDGVGEQFAKDVGSWIVKISKTSGSGLGKSTVGNPQVAGDLTASGPHQTSSEGSQPDVKPRL